MPEEFDPAWEYFTPDPEIEDESPEVSLDFYRDGLRFGCGNPDTERCYTPGGGKSPEETACEGCGKVFLKSRLNARRCSKKCGGRDEIPESRICRCGKPFRPQRKTSFFCSVICTGRVYENKTLVDGDRFLELLKAGIGIGEAAHLLNATVGELVKMKRDLLKVSR